MIKNRVNKQLYWLYITLFIVCISTSCKSYEKVILNTPLKDNNSYKYNPVAISKKKIKHAEVTPFDVEYGVLKKKKNTYKIYFDKYGRFYKEEKYFLGQQVEFTTYYFDPEGNLKEATKYLLFPKKTVKAIARFEYDSVGNVTLDYVKQGDSWQKKIKTYNAQGDLIYQSKVRQKTDKKGRIRKDSSLTRIDYKYDDQNRVSEKFIYNAKRDRLIKRTQYMYDEKGLTTAATYSRTGRLRKMIKYKLNDKGQVIEELYLDSELQKDKVYELLYDKFGNRTQKNFILEGFESNGVESKYNRWGNIVREKKYDHKTNELIQIWKYDYYKY